MINKKEENPEENLETNKRVVSRSIVSEMKDSFIDYAMSVITDRALPDVRDGLKPVHRRILFAMNEIGLSATAKTKKSATIVGDVLGKYHPHGDSSVYEAMVKMAQDFSMRYPLVVGQGNFGSIDGDSAAAYRYTEAKMSRLAGEMLSDIDKDTVDFHPNYDGTKKEPAVLPATVPNLLLNGTLGIAVGMATNIPPHNLSEVVDATIHLADNADATTEDLLTYIKGPDFPTGGIIFNEKDIQHAYATGRGPVVARGVAEIVETKNGQFQIVITEIPYRVNKADLITKIADLVRDKKIEGIKGLRDESSKDIRIVADLKNGSQPQKILNALYKHTQLEDTFHFNLVALVDGVPQTLGLKSMLSEFLKHRDEVVRRRTSFLLARAEDREHILLGLKKALDHIDKIIKLIRASKTVEDAKAGLMKEFKFSERQAQAILEMKLQKLAGLERQKIEDELKEVQTFIKAMKELLASPKKILGVIKNELILIKEKYGDERRTRVIKGGAKVLSVEDLVADEENALVLTSGGYVKRTNPDEYKRQKRGGVGVMGLDTKEEDFVTNFLTASTHSDLLFFTDKGKVYRLRMYEIPEGKRATRGKSIMNYISLTDDEKVTSILPMSSAGKRAKSEEKKDESLLMVTEQGVTKKVAAESFHDVRSSGIIAIRLGDGDRLVSAGFIEKGDSVSVVTKRGQSIRFKEADVREMGRSAGGVRGIKLSKSDVVVGAHVVKSAWKDAYLLTVSAAGFGKRTLISEYKIQGRGGSGILTSKVTTKTGSIMSSQVVTAPTLEEVGVPTGNVGKEIIAISKKSQVVRVDLAEVPVLGRQTQGVRIMKLREGDALASLICL